MAKKGKSSEAEEYLSVEQAAALLGVSVPTLYSYLKEGYLASYRSGVPLVGKRRIYFKRSEVLDLKQQRELLRR